MQLTRHRAVGLCKALCRALLPSSVEEAPKLSETATIYHRCVLVGGCLRSCHPEMCKSLDSGEVFQLQALGPKVRPLPITGEMATKGTISCSSLSATPSIDCWPCCSSSSSSLRVAPEKMHMYVCMLA
jgi:hypothetical protein